MSSGKLGNGSKVMRRRSKGEFLHGLIGFSHPILICLLNFRDTPIVSTNSNCRLHFKQFTRQSKGSLQLAAILSLGDMDCKKPQNYDCDCSYCEYIDLQNSMTSLPIEPNAIQIRKERDSKLKSRRRKNVVDPYETSPLFRRWKSLLMTLRILGSCPLVLDIGDGKRKSTVVFRWISWTSLYSFIVDTFRLVLVFLYYKDWGFIVLGRR